MYCLKGLRTWGDSCGIDPHWPSHIEANNIGPIFRCMRRIDTLPNPCICPELSFGTKCSKLIQYCPRPFRDSIKPFVSHLRVSTKAGQLQWVSFTPAATRPRARQHVATANVDHKGYLAENPLCVQCLAVDRTAALDQVDHVIPVTGPDDPTFWDEDNWQALCAPCHRSKSAKERVH